MRLCREGGLSLLWMSRHRVDDFPRKCAHVRVSVKASASLMAGTAAPPTGTHGRAVVALRADARGQTRCRVTRRCARPAVSTGVRVRECRSQRSPAPGTKLSSRRPHLLIVHAVVVVIVVTGVTCAVLVEVFLPRIRQQGAVVLQSEGAGES